jgi:PKD repeat protein
MKALKTLAAALGTLTLAACTMHSADPAPPLTGPSGPATQVTLQAIPDSISQDGGSQSSIRITAIGPNGRPLANLPLRLDMIVNGVPQDFGTLSARTVATNADGVATVTFTAPPATPLFGTCQGLPGTCIDIVATPIGSGFDAAAPQTTQIRLVPPGVILPPAGTPTAAFTFSPTSATAKSAVVFDASGSQPGNGASQITSYAWTFGDGGSGSGRSVTHSFGESGTFNVTLTVTNDRGLSASTTTAVIVGAGSLPTPVFTFSPAAPRINEAVFFNAAASTAGTGHTITGYQWNFGDGATGSGVSASHIYTVAGVYNVTLTVTDEAGQSATSVATPVPVGSGNPTAVLLLSKTGGNGIVADGSGSTASGTATVTTYTFIWGDGSAPESGAAASRPHTYAVAGTYTVTLRVTDNLGRTGTAPQTIAVP